MIRFRDFSVKTKLSLVAVASSAVALALCCAGFVSNDVRMIRTAKVEQCQALADVLGLPMRGGALGLRDAVAARIVLLQSLKSQAGHRSGKRCLTPGGKVLAAYDKDPRRAASLPAVSGEGYQFTGDGSLQIWRPIQSGGKQVGTLLLCANLNGLRSQLFDYGKISLFVMIFSLNVVLFFVSWMQKGRLQTARRSGGDARGGISEEGDYSVRSGWDANDEIGGLHVAFNLMLDRIESSEAALQKARGELEQRVEDRTAELRQEIVERERAQDALEHARDAAENANRAKSAFLANMSHEIRTPLNAVLGFTDLLRMGGDDGDPAKRQEYLNLIHTSGEHLLSGPDQRRLLDLSKIELGTAGRSNGSPARCTRFLADVVSVLRVRRAGEKGPSPWNTRWEPGVPEVVAADGARLRQLLANFVGNAIKFTTAGQVQIVGRMLRGRRPAPCWFST